MKATRTGGRPEYPPFLTWWLPSFVLHTIRAPLIGTLILLVVAPYYSSLAAAWPYSDKAWFIAGTMIVHAVLYVFINGFFYLCDVYGFLHRYKLPRTQRMIPPKELIRETWRQGFVGQTVAAPLTLWVIYTYFLDGKIPTPTDTLPNPFTLYLHFVAADFLNELLFYLSHRLFHEVRWLYRVAHKQHHQYIGTIGFAAEYAHPLEQILANQGPTASYCFYMAVHPLIWFVWLAWRL